MCTHNHQRIISLYLLLTNQYGKDLRIQYKIEPIKETQRLQQGLFSFF